MRILKVNPGSYMNKILVCPIAFNENVKLKNVIERFLKCSVRNKVDYLVVDDCSEDGTSELINSCSGQGVMTIRHQQRQGVGAAIRTAIKFARENKIPYLGLCLGFQMALIEFARNVCGLKNANTTEVESNCRHPVIAILPSQEKIDKLGGSMRLGGRDIIVKKDSLAYTLYGNKTKIRERFRHRYECNPEYINRLEQKGMVFSGRAPEEEIMQILELPNHPYFIASQFHPEFTSSPGKPNPLFLGLVKSAKNYKRTI